jgi:hypothetical protein
MEGEQYNMKNKKIVNQTCQNQQQIPKSTVDFIILIFMSIVSLFIGCIAIYVAFYEKLDIESTLGWTLFGLIFLIPGIVFLCDVLKQIKLRLNWNKENNVYIKKGDKTTNEANMYQFMSKEQNPNYHIESIDKDLGIKYETKFKKDKYGVNTYFTIETNYGNFKYLDSLLCSVLLTISTISSIVGMVGFIKNRDYINIVTFSIVIPFFAIMDVFFIKNLINGIKEKLNEKKLIKEGKMQKEKMNLGTRLYRMITYTFLLFFGCLLLGLIIQEIGHPLSNDFMKTLIISLFAFFVIDVGIYLIYVIIKYFSKY